MLERILIGLLLVGFAGWVEGAAPSTNPDLPTLWIIGDSTVHNGTKGQVGWGEPIQEMFDTSKINVVNRARGGRSSRTFMTEGLWQQVLDQAKKGDFVIMQFGHNDGGPLSADNRERGSIRGTGDESKEVTLTLGSNKDKKETVHTYGWYMKKYVEDAKAKGMTAIVCAPVPRVPKEKVGEKPELSQSYRQWAQDVAKDQGVGFIDLEALILKRYEGMTPEEIKKKYFTEMDNTHQSAAGAKVNAEAVVEGLRELKSGLVEYLKK